MDIIRASLAAEQVASTVVHHPLELLQGTPYTEVEAGTLHEFRPIHKVCTWLVMSLLHCGAFVKPVSHTPVAVPKLAKLIPPMDSPFSHLSVAYAEFDGGLAATRLRMIWFVEPTEVEQSGGDKYDRQSNVGEHEPAPPQKKIGFSAEKKE